MPEIVVVWDDQEVARVRLRAAEVSIGRLASSGIAINNPKVSRAHARIVPVEGGYRIEDLGSSNGIHLGDDRIHDRVLVDGDVLRIADHYLTYDAAAGADEEAAAAAQESTDEKPHWDHSFNMSPDESNWQALQSVLIDPRQGQEGTERLQALFEISKILEEAKDFDDVLVQIMDKAIKIMGAERGFLMLADHDTGELVCKVARDQSGDVDDVQRETISRSLMRKVMKTKQPELVLNAQGGEWGTHSIMAHSIHAALCSPLLTRNEVAGVIYVDHRSRANAFTKQDLTFFTTFALQAKAAIDSSAAYWELVDSLFKASDDFIVVCSTTGRIQQANVRAAEFVGRAVDEFVGIQLEEILSGTSSDVASAIYRDTMFGGVSSGYELNLKSASGKVIPLSVSAFAMRDRVGNIIGLCMIGRDLTQLKQLMDNLKVANEFIRKTFGRYLSDEIVESLLESPDRLELGGEKRKCTIMMCDLRGFTSLTERLEGEQVVTIINNFLGTMIDVITKHRGTIDEFLGDAILAIFGAPISREDDALRAAACAVEMQLAMTAVNARNREAGFPEVEMGIGLTTGDVVVGNIGSEKRSKYAVVGKHVNNCQRIESNTVGGQILIAKETYDDAGPTLELGVEMGLKMKGVKGLLTVYELRGVGGPYGLQMPTLNEEMVSVPHELVFQFAELEGKHVSDELVAARVVRLSGKGAEVVAAQHPPALANVKLIFADPQTGQPFEEDAYGKVIEHAVEGQDGFYIRFTLVPPGLEGLLKSITG